MNTDKRSTVAVVHLVWLPYGIDKFQNFIDSYIRFSAGSEHELMIVFNGVDSMEQTEAYHAYASQFQLVYQSMYISNGFDLACYFQAAKKLTCDYVLFLNSYSIILSDDWLKKYVTAIQDSTVGAIAATASLQSYYSAVFQKGSLMIREGKGFSHNFNKIKLYIKALLYWRLLFKPFPNAHLRTNAFMLKRELFLTLKHKPFIKKFDAYLFESGRNSLTVQLFKRGYKTLVIDRVGKTYGPNEWITSKTFWMGKQENLLIADNQTSLYTNANEDIKNKLIELAWGS